MLTIKSICFIDYIVVCQFNVNDGCKMNNENIIYLTHNATKAKLRQQE